MTEKGTVSQKVFIKGVFMKNNKIKIVSLVLLMSLSMLPFVSCSDNSQGQNDGEFDLQGTYNISIWVSEKEGVAEQFQKQIDAFEEENDGVIIIPQIEGVPEGDAGSKVVADVATAPDMYCFAQDQLSRLVQAAALSPLGKGAADRIRQENDEGSVASASIGSTIYAYPMTSDNGYFMYYDTSIISESDAEDMTKIIAACEKAGKKFRFGLENAWYTGSFFFGAGCRSSWTVADDGSTFTSVDDDFNSEKGMIAMKGMRQLTTSSCYDSNADIFTDAGAIITGIWNAEAAEKYFGKNLGATDLPSFTVDGKSYHLGSFSGNKLLGVKPQSDSKRAAVLSKLAQYLTGEQCQKERFDSFQWGPSNRNAQSSDAVQANISLAALAKQSPYGVPQGQIHGSWWDIAKVLGAESKTAKTDAALKKALENYEAAIKAAIK